MNFSLVVPLWNEGKNVVELVSAIADSGLPENGMGELILVNNGSSDDTGKHVDSSRQTYSWVVPVHLKENLNYGGGVYEGFKFARSEILCYIPGDLQVMPDDVIKIYKVFRESSEESLKLFVKGHRTLRYDPMQSRFVSAAYTLLANLLLGLNINDVNGLPKMFHRSLMDLVPAERMKTFVFDAQIISLARYYGWPIKEVPVTFYSRREGVSTWSNKRIQIYITVFKQLIRLRTLINAEGVPLDRNR